MTNIKEIVSMREGVSLEVKKAAGGLPNSLWESYSAFANTEGGIILLGVEEDENRNLHVTGLSNPEQMLSDFWNQINNRQKVSVNILTQRNVTVEDIEGKKVIAIKVPRAERGDKPVYLNNNLLDGSYRRNGEGDYKCTHEDVKAMLRDAAVQTHDTRVLNEMPLSVFDSESVRRYRTRMQYTRPGHVWSGIEDVDFLHKLGCVGRGKDGQLHPTAAGLLMFGFEYEIVREFPEYFLDYREQDDPSMRWTDRIHSASGEWSGNVFDFFFRVYNRLSQTLKVPFKLDGITRIDDTPMHKAVREALANCLINADYCGRRGIVIIKDLHILSFANPGGLRIAKEIAISGGVSDPRNSTLMKMFNLIDVGERSGSGLPGIFDVWQKNGLKEPKISESFSPDRCVLELDNPFEAIVSGNIDTDVGTKAGDAPVNGYDDPVKCDKKIGHKIKNREKELESSDGTTKETTKETTNKTTNKTTKKTTKATTKNSEQSIREMMLEFMCEDPEITVKELSMKVGISADGVNWHIKKLKSQGRLLRVGPDKGGHWQVVDNGDI